MIITRKAWKRYIDLLRKLNDKAAEDMIRFQKKLAERGITGDEAARILVEYAYQIATKYGEGATAAACEMYDAVATLSKAAAPAAVPAATATYGETAKAVYGTLKQNPEIVPSAVGRLVKMAGVDTVMQNAIRDGAEWAWVPSGDTCAFCITLASRGWQRASMAHLNGGHAEHIHANCDCTFAIRFNGKTNVEGYDPSKYESMYYGAEGSTPEQRINSMRRQFYQQNKDEINAQKRAAYAKRMERDSSKAEELDV